MKTITYSETLWVTIDNALRSDPWRDVPGAAEAGGKLTLHFGPWWPDFALTIGKEPETIEFDEAVATGIE